MRWTHSFKYVDQRDNFSSECAVKPQTILEEVLSKCAHHGAGVLGGKVVSGLECVF